MATTRTGPSINWAQAGSDLWNLTLDTARSKLIDVEQSGDERNVPDYTDMRAGILPTQTATGTAAPQAAGSAAAAVAGVPKWVLWGGAALLGAAVVWKIAD